MNSKTIFSIVVITKDNISELLETISTIPKSKLFLIELIVIDSSLISSKIDYECHNLIYKHTKPKGIYAAQNLGISFSTGDYIIVMNSGDGFNKNSNELLDKITVLDMYDAFVFSQLFTKPDGKILHTYFPSKDSIWPHQSVVLKNDIYKKFGLYNEKYIYAADQIYFTEIRDFINVYYGKDILSYFTHGGVSTGYPRLILCKENYIIWRNLNKSVLFSFIKSFIFPYIRYLLESILGLNDLGLVLRKLYDKNIDNK